MPPEEQEELAIRRYYYRLRVNAKKPLPTWDMLPKGGRDIVTWEYHRRKKEDHKLTQARIKINKDLQTELHTRVRDAKRFSSS